MPPISRVYVERALVDRKRVEELHAVGCARQLGIEPELTSIKGLHNKSVDAQTLCVGSVPFVRAAMHAAGRKLPAHDPYPAVLQAWLHRKTGFSRRLLDTMKITKLPVFVKPACCRRPKTDPL